MAFQSRIIFTKTFFCLGWIFFVSCTFFNGKVHSINPRGIPEHSLLGLISKNCFEKLTEGSSPVTVSGFDEYPGVESLGPLVPNSHNELLRELSVFEKEMEKMVRTFGKGGAKVADQVFVKTSKLGEGPYYRVMVDISSCFGSHGKAGKRVSICSMGDLHGSIHSLIRNLIRLYLLGFLDENLKILDTPTEERYMVFTGDFVDRAIFGAETLNVILKLFLANNHGKVFLIKGNHEDISIASMYGFANELNHKYRKVDDVCNETPIELFENHVFSKLPTSLFFYCGNKKIMFCHGGFEIPSGLEGFHAHDIELDYFKDFEKGNTAELISNDSAKNC